jgi:hypothetical protein
MGARDEWDAIYYVPWVVSCYLDVRYGVSRPRTTRQRVPPPLATQLTLVTPAFGSSKEC